MDAFFVGEAEFSFPDYLKEIKLREQVARPRMIKCVRTADLDDLPFPDYSIFPSLWEEPFGITLLEAIACGTAVIATATGGAAEILRHGENALVVPVDDAPAIAQAIMRLRGDPELRRKLVVNARWDVEARYCLAATVAVIESFLVAAVSQKSG